MTIRNAVIPFFIKKSQAKSFVRSSSQVMRSGVHTASFLWSYRLVEPFLSENDVEKAEKTNVQSHSGFVLEITEVGWNTITGAQDMRH